MRKEYYKNDFTCPLRLLDRDGAEVLVGGHDFTAVFVTGSPAAFRYAFQDWASSENPGNEVDLLSLPAEWQTGGLDIDCMCAGLRNVRSFPFLSVNDCAGAFLFQRNPDRPPYETGPSRRCVVVGIGHKCTGAFPQTDLSGLVNWNTTDMELSLSNTADKAAVSGWRILLSNDCYTRLSSSMRASLAAKGFTVVNAG